MCPIKEHSIGCFCGQGARLDYIPEANRLLIEDHNPGYCECHRCANFRTKWGDKVQIEILIKTVTKNGD